MLKYCNNVAGNMSSSNKFVFNSKLANKSYTFEPTINQIAVAFPPSKSSNRQEIEAYEKEIIEEIEEHSTFGDYGSKKEQNVDLQVKNINGKRGIALVVPFIADEPEAGSPESQASEKSKKLQKFSKIISYMTAVIDKTEGNNNKHRYFASDRFVAKAKGSLKQFSASDIVWIINEQRGLLALKTPFSQSKHIEASYYFDYIDKQNKNNQSIEWAEGYEFGVNASCFWEPKDKHYYTDRIQWGLRNTGSMAGSISGVDMNVYNAWNTGIGGPPPPIGSDTVRTNYESYGNYGTSNVVIALIDYGVEDTHSDFDPAGDDAIISGGNQNFTGVGAITDISDSSLDSHGTHLAGIIAGRKINSTGYTTKRITGVAPMCKVMPLKINTETFDYQEAVNAIDYVIDNAVSTKRYIICIGWSTGDNAQIRAAITDAFDNHNILVVCAAGNGNTGTPTFPAKHPRSIAAGAHTNSNVRRSNSNWGTNEAGEAVIFAPGQIIRSTIKGNTWADKDGTSCAAAFLAGAAGVLWSRDYKRNSNTFTRTRLQIKTLIRNHTVAVTGGFVRHNLQAAVASVNP